jgi:chromatin remodeling complex protein RSC6
MSSEATLSQTQNGETGMTLTSLLLELTDIAGVLSQQSRELQRTLKNLSSELQKEQKRSTRNIRADRPKRTVVQKPVQVNQAMNTFLTSQNVTAVDGGYTRQVMMKAISGYIHNQKLQLEENKKEWKPDATLVKLFNLDKTKVYTFMNINGLLSRVVLKA